MRILGSREIFAWILVALCASCSGEGTVDESNCVPGEQRSCGCPLTGLYTCRGSWFGAAIGLSSVETCSADGSHWSRCACGELEPGCDDICAPLADPTYCEDDCSCRMRGLLEDLPAEADAEACRAAYLSWYPCHAATQPEPECSGLAEQLDAACRPVECGGVER